MRATPAAGGLGAAPLPRIVPHAQRDNGIRVFAWLDVLVGDVEIEGIVTVVEGLTEWIGALRLYKVGDVRRAALAGG